jgi:hypothetical protein
MSLPSQDIPKGKMSITERNLRSRLTKLIQTKGLIRGTLTTRANTCGKSSCKCARGEKHVALYLVVSVGGKLRQLFVPKSFEEKVRQWIDEYRQVERLLDEIADVHWAKIQDREE